MPFTKKFYSKLVASSHLVEDFLDFHGAKNNKNWYLFREMSAAVRHLSMAGYIQEHISNRLVFYELSNKAVFEKEGEQTRIFLGQTLISLAPPLLFRRQGEHSDLFGQRHRVGQSHLGRESRCRPHVLAQDDVVHVCPLRIGDRDVAEKDQGDPDVGLAHEVAQGRDVGEVQFARDP